MLHKSVTKACTLALRGELRRRTVLRGKLLCGNNPTRPPASSQLDPRNAHPPTCICFVSLLSCSTCRVASSSYLRNASSGELWRMMVACR